MLLLVATIPINCVCVFVCVQATHPSNPWRPPARLGQGLAPWALALDLGGLCGVQLEDQWGH